MKKYFLFLGLFAMISSCCVINYADGVAKDSMQLYKIKKDFIIERSFLGVVKEKSDNGRGDLEYKMRIEFINIVSVGDSVSSDYYGFYTYNSKELTIAVSKELYSVKNVGDTIKKLKGSEYIEENHGKYKFCSW